MEVESFDFSIWVDVSQEFFSCFWCIRFFLQEIREGASRVWRRVWRKIMAYRKPSLAIRSIGPARSVWISSNGFVARISASRLRVLVVFDRMHVSHSNSFELEMFIPSSTFSSNQLGYSDQEVCAMFPGSRLVS